MLLLKILMSCFVLAQDVVTNENNTGDLVSFKKGYESYLKQQFETSEKEFLTYLQSNGRLQEHSHFYLGQIHLFKKNNEAAREHFLKALTFKPNLKIWIESQLNLAKIELSLSNFSKAKGYLTNIERRARGTDFYPYIIYNLALVELKNDNRNRSCIWLKKLYAQKPNFELIKDWGPVLSENIFEGSKTNCSNQLEDFQRRMRFLLLTGNEDKAKSEMEIISEKLKAESQFKSDQIRAQFYLQDGEPRKSFELLQPYYQDEKNNSAYLYLLAQSAARGGEESLSIGIYDRVFKLNQKNRKGLEALYQSAFMSYQALDYDGATRKFKNYIRLTTSKKLKKEAQWHLAWLQYLKGNFAGAEKSLRVLLKLSNYRDEKIQYWFAMSLFRQGKSAEAKIIFDKLSKDPLLSYYSIASNYRLKKFNSIAPDGKSNKESESPALRVNPLATLQSSQVNMTWLSRFSGRNFLLPSDDMVGSLEADEEETLQQSLSQIVNDVEDESIEADTDKVQETGASEIIPGELESEKITSFQDPNLLRRFEKAQDLVVVGINDLAKWDLFEIEKKTSNKEYLRILMTEYSSLNNFNRSSTIATLYFRDQQKKYGISGIRYLWEMSYPQAYLSNVQTYSSKFEVPKELIWGIMRAESKYKLDAVSPVGALGLMQIMPFTGRRVSLLIGEKNFTPQSLLTDEGAIKYGSRYLKRLMTKFESVYPLVSAAYNAGPHRVQNWISSFGHLDTDEFIEHIPFIETRGYVKKVLSNTEIYNQLYGDKKEMHSYLADAVPYKYTTDIKLTKEIWDEI